MDAVVLFTRYRFKTFVKFQILTQARGDDIKDDFDIGRVEKRNKTGSTEFFRHAR